MLCATAAPQVSRFVEPFWTVIELEMCEDLRLDIRHLIIYSTTTLVMVSRCNNQNTERYALMVSSGGHIF